MKMNANSQPEQSQRESEHVTGTEARLEVNCSRILKAQLSVLKCVIAEAARLLAKGK
jgi:hypothetical protein